MIGMNWPDLSMGGYGFYVWGSYLFALLAIVWELVTLSYRKKAQQQEKPVTKAVRGKANETTS
jgi:heme exporter protein D